MSLPLPALTLPALAASVTADKSIESAPVPPLIELLPIAPLAVIATNVLLVVMLKSAVKPEASTEANAVPPFAVASAL